MRTPLDWYKSLKLRISGKAADAEKGSSNQSEEPIEKEPTRGSLRRHLLTLFETPDKYWGWYRPAIRLAEMLIEREHIDVLFSTAPPFT